MGQFKPMVKMMTTEPSVELKLKKGGVVKKADGGMMGMPSSMPTSMPASMPARGGMMAAMAPKRPPLAARRRAMAVPAPATTPVMKKGGKAEGGESKAEHKAEMAKMAKTEKELKKHESMPASKAHKGLKTGGVVMGQGGYKKGGRVKMASGGIINTEDQGGEYRNTKMHTAEGEDHTPKKTGDVRMGNAGGYKHGGKVHKYAKGGGVEGNISGTPPGKTNTTTGEVRKGNAGGYKKGGSAKKAYATGGLVDTGKPVAMPKKAASKPVSISKLSGTFKKGGKVQKYAEGGYSDVEDLSKGAYDRSIGPSEDEMALARTMRELPSKMYSGAKKLLGLGTPSAQERKVIAEDTKPKTGSVTRTEKSITVTPAKKRGGSVKC